jgi:hypothetical protein
LSLGAENEADFLSFLTIELAEPCVHKDFYGNERGPATIRQLFEANAPDQRPETGRFAIRLHFKGGAK